MIADRENIVKELGSRLEQAARASVAKGAFYEPGEKISRDSVDAWKQVADMLVNLVEAMIRHKGELEKVDGPQS